MYIGTKGLYTLDRVLRQNNIILPVWEKSAVRTSTTRYTFSSRDERLVANYYQQSTSIEKVVIGGKVITVNVGNGEDNFITKKLAESGGAFCLPNVGEIFISPESLGSELSEFSIGHELGHINYDRERSEIRSYNEIIAEEIYADNFAYGLISEHSMEEILLGRYGKIMECSKSTIIYHFPRMVEIANKLKELAGH